MKNKTKTYNSVTSYKTTDDKGKVSTKTVEATRTVESPNESSFSLSDGVGLVKTIFLILILINLFYALRGDDNFFSFTRLFEIFQNAPSVDLTLLNALDFETGIQGNWGIIDGLRTFLNSCWSLIGVGLYIVAGIIQLLKYIVYFIRGIFL